MTKYDNTVLGRVNAERINETTAINPEIRQLLTKLDYAWLVHVGEVKIPLTADIFDNEFRAVRETASV